MKPISLTAALFVGLVVMLVAFGVALALVVGGGDSDKPDEPEFVRPNGSSSSGSSGAAPEIIRSQAGGSTHVLVGPVAVTGSTTAPVPSGLTLKRTESATVPADDAYIVALIPRPPGPTPFGQLSSRDQSQLLAALQALGVKEEDITIDSSTSFGPFTSVSVHVGLSGLAAGGGKQVLDVVEATLGRSQSSGVRFALKDCSTALTPLRKQALDAIAADAKAFAQSAALSLGPLVAVSQSPTLPIYGPLAGDPCSPQSAPGPKGGGAILPLESKPEVRLSVDLNATYSLGAEDGGAGLTATGSGTATAKADEAYVIASVSANIGPFGPQPVPQKSREDLIAKIRGLGFDESDIEVDSSRFGAPVVVSVEMDLAKLAQRGKDVIAAVEEVFGRSDVQGVWFSHSNCQAVLTEARKQALGEAKRNAESLAAAANLQLGGLLALSDAAPQPGPFPVSNPCSEDVAATVGLGNGPYGLALKPLDAKPEFSLTTAVSVTFAISGR